ncbi:uncharacterized protein LOC114316918 [Camellia sinensis]|uniref:Transcriptional coactivator Hfi1/Transcriptional adapter 1 n=1 Tax=Camellia sinensis var. sinensis TaxID=542762 RepID=A0A4S4D2M7_CAMSN|nr:uncharacterized protein LOC114316918 [Camellia sinensis]THF96529.1 hypothetical protein TEA_025160 [Camellia sinensis var. sinensis]
MGSLQLMGIKMPVGQQPSTVELKLQIERNLGFEKAEKYFCLLNRYLRLKISKSEFDRHCIGTIGRENICLHNRLIRAIIKNACVGKTPPPKESKTGSSLNVKVSNGYQRSSLQSLCRDVFPQSPRKGRSPSFRDRKSKDRPSPLGPHGKAHSVGCEDSVPKIQEQQSATELLSLGSGTPPEGNSVEEGEEVEQAAGSPSIYSRSPVRAPLGMSINGKETRKVLRKGSATASHIHSCLNNDELPNTSSLKTRLEQKLEMDGLKFSMDCVSLLNNSIDIYLKRLIKPCLELAASRSGNKHSSEVPDQVVFGLNGMMPVRYVHKANRPVFASLLDFRVTMESNPRRLGEDWPVQLEKIFLRASDQE